MPLSPSRVYYVSPFAWGVRALVVNEFTSPRWNMPAAWAPGRTVGEEALASFGFFTDRRWIWGGVGALLGVALVFNVISSFALIYLSGERPPEYAPGFLTLV